MIKYEVNEKNEIYAWNLDVNAEVPFLYQPHYPDGTPFESREAAQAWANNWYEEFTSPKPSITSEELTALKEAAKQKVLNDEPLTPFEAELLT